MCVGFGMSNLIYPDFQRNPLNDNFSAEYRKAVLESLNAFRLWILENDVNCTFDHKTGRQAAGWIAAHIDESVKQYKKENGL